ncbi:ELMO domain-containing protein 2 [Folsomia candida]|uniref:ELMO domain-containing protein 1 n=1 Tax=Folsomia candida TaxID=158441 RepID=A0A226E732_FOLCA|nr:ELMO domain-containing protein 2 [Folsomia candida]OXA53269.1 ELMO domain-containing protein 1 [Folsomia candida]
MFKYILTILYTLYCWVATLVRRVGKVFMRKVTRLTELQRIVYGEVLGFRRIKRVEESLMRSKNPDVIRALEELDCGVLDGRFEARGTRKVLVMKATADISTAKKINMKLHSRFVNGLQECLEMIFAFKYLCAKLKVLRDTPYSSDKDEDEDKLLQLWTKMMKGTELSGRKSKQWEILGFQGSDPATDFRGGGILSLDSLSFITSRYPEVSQRLLHNSHHPLYSYPYALVVIQISFLAANLCLEGVAKTHFYNRYPVILRLDREVSPMDNVMWRAELIKLFHEFTTSLLIDFDSLWMASKPKSIMAYSEIKSVFDKTVIKKLKSDTTCYLIEVRTI